MEWVNTNAHRAVVDDPENESGNADSTGLLVISADATVSAKKGGLLAAKLEACPGLEPASSDKGEDHLDGMDERDALLAGPGPKAYPAETDEIDGPVRGDTGGGDDGSYESRTVKQLRALAKRRDLDVPSKARKADLIAVLRAAE